MAKDSINSAVARDTPLSNALEALSGAGDNAAFSTRI